MTSNDLGDDAQQLPERVKKPKRIYRTPSLQGRSRENEAITVFKFPGLAHLGSVLPIEHPDYGYPDLLLLATLVCNRIWASQSVGLTEIGKKGVWAKLIAAYAKGTGNPGPFPSIPPSARTLDRFVTRIAEDRPLWLSLQECFTASAVTLARRLGQFTPNVEPDWTSINPDHLIVGDGTYVKPFSDVREVRDPVTKELVVLGSRAEGTPRIQRSVTDASQDDKTAVGINHVTITTPTTSGWVVLAVEQAFGAEIRTASAMIDDIVVAVGDGVHAVAWDGAYKGVSKETLTAKHGVLVLTKPVARPDTHQRTVTGGLLSEANAIAAFKRSEALPLGTSVFPTSRGHEMVRTYAYRFGPIPDTACAHDLWVDGEALVDVAREKEYSQPLKVAHARAVRASRHTYKSGRFGIATLWSLPCPDAGEHHFTTISQPRRDEKEKPLGEIGKTINAASPIPRAASETFADGYGFRNWSESFNSWFKAHLGTSAGTARAMRLRPAHQAIDHLCVGLLANSITYRHHRRKQRFSTDAPTGYASRHIAQREVRVPDTAAS